MAVIQLGTDFFALSFCDVQFLTQFLDLSPQNGLGKLGSGWGVWRLRAAELFCAMWLTVAVSQLLLEFAAFSVQDT
jgi:hypothetical protein